MNPEQPRPRSNRRALAPDRPAARRRCGAVGSAGGCGPRLHGPTCRWHTTSAYSMRSRWARLPPSARARPTRPCSSARGLGPIRARLKAPNARATGAMTSRAGPLARSIILANAWTLPANACASAPCTSAKAMPGEGNHCVAYWLSPRHSSGSRASPAISARSRNEAESESVFIGGPVETPDEGARDRNSKPPPRGRAPAARARCAS